MRFFSMILVVGVLATLPACGSEAPVKDGDQDAGVNPEVAAPSVSGDLKGTEDEARAVIEGLLKASSKEQAVARTRALQPTEADYAAMFKAPLAADLAAMHAPLWKQDVAFAPKEGQTNLLLWSASSEELQSGTGDSREFPGGYRRAAPLLKPGLTWYRFKFVKPGETLGMAFDGLTFVNGRWVMAPKPWRAVKDD